VIDHPAIYEDLTVPVSFSYGCAATTDVEMESPEDLLRKADERLYRAKHHRARNSKKP